MYKTGMKFLFIVGSFLMISLVSCSKENNDNSSENKRNYKVVTNKDGVKTIFNRNKPSDENLKFGFKEVLTIKGEDESSNNPDRLFTAVDRMSIDDSGNIYLFDTGSFSIKKFDKSGKFINSFGRKGTGPGEYVNQPSLTCLDDTLYVADGNNNKILLFDNKGKFVRDILFSAKAPKFLFPAGKNKFVGLDFGDEIAGEKMYIKSRVSVYNAKLENVKVLTSKKIDFNLSNPQMNPMDFIQLFNSTKNIICTGEISENKYRINVFDLSGNLKFNIEKGYKKVKMNKEEAKKMGKNISVSDDNGNIVKNKIKDYYKKAINGIFIDKYERIWINPAIEYKNGEKIEKVDLYFDIFDKDGVFLKRFSPDFFKDSNDFRLFLKFTFYGEYLYIIDKENDDFVIKVFEYL